MILSTQFSFGRLFAPLLASRATLSARGAGCVRAPGATSGARRSSGARCIAKHTQEGRAEPATRRDEARQIERPRAGTGRERRRARHATTSRRCRRRRRRPVTRSPPQDGRCAPPLPLPEPEPRQGAAAAQGRATRCRRASLLDAAKAERKIDERELMDVGAAARGEVPRVLGRRPVVADPSRARWSRPSSSSPTPA